MRRRGSGRWRLVMGVSLGLLAWPRVGAAADPLCDGLVARVRALPPVGAASELWAGPMQRLAEQPSGYVRLDQTGNLFHGGDPSKDATALRTRMQKQYHAPAPVMAAVNQMDLANGGMAWVHRLGSSSVRALELVQGTMDCSTFLVFDAPVFRSARLIDSPPQVAGVEGGFCGTDQGLFGAVGGAPAFIEQSWPSTDPDYDIVLSAWRSGHWTVPCEVKVSYNRVYRVRTIHCRGDLCAALPDAAINIAASRDLQLQASADDAAPPFQWGAPPSQQVLDKVAQIQVLIGPPATAVLPTLGDTADEVGLGEDAVVFPVQLAGQTYAAVLGHRSIGWRVFPQYLLALYDIKDGKLDPVAGLIIEQSQGALASIRTQPWQKPKPEG
jgi:hypothetical protein